MGKALKAGRPSDYKPEFAKQAAKLCELGATDKELAEFFQVNTVTIYRWRNENETFCKAVIAGKQNADARVERSLYNRAVGYTFESEKVFQFQGEIIRAPTLEHVPPDPGAALNWLKNRQGDKWRDNTSISMTVGPSEAMMELLRAVGRGDMAKKPDMIELEAVEVETDDGNR